MILNIIRSGRRAFKTGLDFCQTAWAIQGEAIVWVRFRLEDHALALLIAACTYPMRGFALVHRCLQGIGNNPRLPKRGQLIALLLTLPCFMAHNFLFEQAYFFAQRRLLRLSLRGTGQGVDQNGLQLNDFGTGIGKGFDFYQAFYDVIGRLKPVNSALNKGHVHDGFKNWQPKV